MSDTTEKPEWGTEDYWRHAVLFNDVTRAPVSRHIFFSDIRAIADYLWAQGWRREVRPEDVTERSPLPLHRTEAGYPHCSTCDGGGCLDCTDPA